MCIAGRKWATATGEARRGEARRGEARRGGARRGEAGEQGRLRGCNSRCGAQTARPHQHDSLGDRKPTQGGGVAEGDAGGVLRVALGAYGWGGWAKRCVRVGGWMGERRRPLCCARRGSVVARGTHHSSRERVLRVILWCTWSGLGLVLGLGVGSGSGLRLGLGVSSHHLLAHLVLSRMRILPTYSLTYLVLLPHLILHVAHRLGGQRQWNRRVWRR